MTGSIDGERIVPWLSVAAGATEVRPVTEEHGWRTGRVVDPFGHHWELARFSG